MHPRLGDRAADLITTIAGSWWLVGVHTVWFAAWLLLRLDINLLTLAVSLEAIYLSTFVLMSQGRAADRDRAMIERQAASVEDIDALEHEDRAILREMHQLIVLQQRHMGLPETSEEGE